MDNRLSTEEAADVLLSALNNAPEEPFDETMPTVDDAERIEDQGAVIIQVNLGGQLFNLTIEAA